MRLIDADAIKLPKGFFEEVDNVPKFYEWLNKQPTIEERKTGRWIADDLFSRPRCSECGELCFGLHAFDYELTRYCPNCGARMEVQDE